MRYDWKEFEVFANEVMRHESAIGCSSCPISPETLKRNAISRLYYHAFHCLRNWAVKNINYVYGNQASGTHSDLFAYIQSSEKATDDDMKIMGACKSMKQLRTTADYIDDPVSWDKLLSKAKKKHGVVISAIGNYGQRPY